MKISRPLVIIGQLERAHRGQVLEFLSPLNFPVYAECLSGLRGENKIKHLVTVDRPAQLEFDSVVRIGGVPTCRVWRDLDEKLKSVPVYNVSERAGLPGISRACENLVGLHSLRSLEIVTDNAWIDAMLSESERLSARLKTVLAQFPESEMSLFAKISEKVRGGDLYVGNSLPIREWDLVSSGLELRDIFANRGANGIDGQLSSFFGWSAEAGVPAWSIVGDLTAMYDLAAPWIVKQLAHRQRRIVVINNGGGMIFKKLFREETLLNRHAFGFSDWAKQWGLHYQTTLEQPTAETAVIELRPDEKQSDFFREAWESK